MFQLTGIFPCRHCRGCHHCSPEQNMGVLGLWALRGIWRSLKKGWTLSSAPTKWQSLNIHAGVVPQPGLQPHCPILPGTSWSWRCGVWWPPWDAANTHGWPYCSNAAAAAGWNPLCFSIQNQDTSMGWEDMHAGQVGKSIVWCVSSQALSDLLKLRKGQRG